MAAPVPPPQLRGGDVPRRPFGDVVVLLPGLTGIRVCQKVRELPEGKGVKTILLSTVYRQFKDLNEFMGELKSMLT